MATLVVFKFPTAQGAEIMLSTLESLQKQHLIQVVDGPSSPGRWEPRNPRPNSSRA
jgi:hypothetical protein